MPVDINQTILCINQAIHDLRLAEDNLNSARLILTKAERLMNPHYLQSRIMVGKRKAETYSKEVSNFATGLNAFLSELATLLEDSSEEDSSEEDTIWVDGTS